MWDEIWQLLGSTEPRNRALGWTTLQNRITAGDLAPRQEDIVRLLAHFHAEIQDPVRRAAVAGLITLTALRGVENVAQAASAATHVEACLLSPFQHSSVACRGFDAIRHRDEDAMIALARLLSDREFPNTEFIRIPLDDPQWTERLDHHPHAVCLVGRPGIFGERAVEEFYTAATRFYFPQQVRPPDLGPGEIDPQRFHRIQERRGGTDTDRAFCTTQNADRRTDFAVLQRYYQRTKRRHVLLLAGCSTLGTLGAVHFLRELGRIPIPLPAGGIGERATIEALVQVSAPLCDHASQWKPDKDIHLVRLIVDDRLEWFPAPDGGGEWLSRTPDRIFIERDADGRGTNVYIDEPHGRPTFHDRSEAVRAVDLIASATEGRPGNTVEVSQLDAGNSLGKLLKSPVNRQRIHKKLSGAISANRDFSLLTLNVPIEIVDTRKAAGPPVASDS
ncbi:MAG TPA: hypothetical protein VML55_20345 [Planctomycetaceae bacterium]|nr:hypothetical protein [Planctomycetaceae bacterium]